ncbi:MAG: hypothetical protein OXP71_07565 [Candidatus Poribacteria bacterium]|nr:hypothetical protein [Candidatus Poribacteria bacterium]
MQSCNQRHFIKVVEHQLNAIHLSPLWGFSADFTLFPIHLSPRWGLQKRQNFTHLIASGATGV